MAAGRPRTRRVPAAKRRAWFRRWARDLASHEPDYYRVIGRYAQLLAMPACGLRPADLPAPDGLHRCICWAERLVDVRDRATGPGADPGAAVRRCLACGRLDLRERYAGPAEARQAGVFARGWACRSCTNGGRRHAFALARAGPPAEAFDRDSATPEDPGEGAQA